MTGRFWPGFSHASCSPSSLISPLRLGDGTIATVGSSTPLPNTGEPSSRINHVGLFGRLCYRLGRLIGTCTGLVGFRRGESGTQARGRYKGESKGRGSGEGGVGNSMACPHRSLWVDVEVLSI